MLKGQNWSTEEYRYGFNGKEMDDEVSVDDGSYDFGARIYDARLGRWYSADLMYMNYSDLSVYNYAANNPLYFIDPDGNVIRVYCESRIEGEKGHWRDYVPGIRPTTGEPELLKVHQALSYQITVSETANGMWCALSEAAEILEILPTTDVGDRSMEFNSNEMGQVIEYDMGKLKKEKAVKLGSISWDYDSAFTFNTTQGTEGPGGDDKGFIAPATALLHEGGHGLRALRVLLSGDQKTIAEWQSKSLGTFSNGGKFTNAEEMENIQEFEQPYIKEANAWEQLNNSGNPQYQPLRYNHSAVNSVRIVKNPCEVANPSVYLKWRSSALSNGQTVDDGIK